MSKFRVECEQWLRPLGYSVWSSHKTEDTESYNFNHDRAGENWPTITCSMDALGDKQAKICAGDLKYFFRIMSVNIAVGHSDIQKFVDVARHYSIICSLNEPSL